jgi:hypothetical protein
MPKHCCVLDVGFTVALCNLQQQSNAGNDVRCMKACQHKVKVKERMRVPNNALCSLLGTFQTFDPQE